VICLGAVLFLDIGTLLIQLFFYHFDFFVRQQILYVHNANAVMGIQCGELLHGALFQPLLQINAGMIVEGVQCKNRQCKIINPKVLVCQLHGNGIMLMDFRQNFSTFCFDFRLDFPEQIPDFRLYEKAAGIRFLHGIGEGIQTNDSRAVLTHAFQRVADEGFCLRLGNIQVDLLLAEGAPNFFGRTICKCGIDIGGTGLAFIDLVNLFLCWRTVFPEVGVADEVVPIGGIFFSL